MDIRIRPFEDRDHEANAAVFSNLFPDFPITGDDSRRVDAGRRNLIGVVAETLDEGRAVGFGAVWQDPYMNHPGKYWIWVLVGPAWQRRGIGSSIYDWLMGELSKLGAESAWSNARNDNPQHLEFVRRRGFRELWRNITQQLSVREADVTGIEEATTQARERGITIVTLSEEAQQNPDHLRALSELHNHVMADVPRAGYFTPVSYDEFAEEFSQGTHLPDGYFLAKRRDKLVGLSYLQRTDGAPGTLEAGLTGTRREYRRQGIGRVLKLHTIKYARERGFDAIETGSDSFNVAMLSLNESLGFRKIYAWVTFERDIP